MKRGVIALLSLIAVTSAVTSACSDDTDDSKTTAAPTSTRTATSFTMQGRASLAPAYTRNLGGGRCEGASVLAPFRLGAPVSVTDAVGTTVGATTLGDGTMNAIGECELWFRPEVKIGSDFYQIVVATATPMTVTADHARYKGVALSFGYNLG